MIASRRLKYQISLSYIKNNFNRKKDMVVHHGLMGSCKNFKSITKNNQISNHVNSYLIDCRNHGESPYTQTNSIQDLANDLCEFIQQHKLNRKDHLTLMGHSMGALAIMKLTQKYPELQSSINRIILIDIYCKVQKSQNSRLKSTEKMLKKMLEIDLNQSTEQVFKQIEERAGDKDTAGLLKMNIKIDEEKKKHRWIPNIQTILKQYNHFLDFKMEKTCWEKPIQVIYGAKSHYVNDEQISKYCDLYPQMKKNENFHKIQGAGHWVHFQKTSDFLKTVNSILKKNQI